MGKNTEENVAQCSTITRHAIMKSTFDYTHKICKQFYASFDYLKDADARTKCKEYLMTNIAQLVDSEYELY